MEAWKVLTAEGNLCSVSAADSVSLKGNTSLGLYGPEESDLIVALGGDGAVLRSAQIAIRADKPLVGINSGRLGFLCALSYEHLQDFFSLLDTFLLTERTLLECSYDGKVYYAVNDVLVGKPNLGETVSLTVTVDGEEVGQVRGDGLILATPTGSTAYNRSAGGPILEHSAASFILTPVCSRSEFNRPLIVNDRRVITLAERLGNAQINVDGLSIGLLKKNAEVKRSEKTLLLYSSENNIRKLIRLA